MAVERRKCIAVVLKKDQHRYTGRGKHGFEMHYKKAHCTRNAVCDAGLCRQHMLMPNVQTWKAI